ncbi:MAG TPA: Na+/H+ antiporter [Bacilli bacterium]|nr:Na+/H+ antiporter [Bacilli bacterium]
MHGYFELILLLLAIATLVVAVAKKLNHPYPIALVIVGAVIGLTPVMGLEELKEFVAEDEVFHFAIISIFLPALLGEAVLKLPFSHLLQNKRPILFLALGATLLTFVVVGFGMHYVLGLSVVLAFTFAALMSATDPVSVISIFKSMRVNHRLETIIEGESLLNDGIAVVLFNISAYSLLQYMEAGALGFGFGLLDFLKVVLGGLAIGGVLGFVFSRLTKLYDDYPLEIIFSMLLFYGSFFLAEMVHVSGVIAVVTGGLIFGNYGARIGMSPTTKLAIRAFWDVVSLIANAIVFLMVGLEITRIEMDGKWHLIAIAILVVLVARSIGVYASTAFVRNIPMAWRHILNWGGLKGSLSIALVLSLPLGFDGRETLLVLAFGVVLFSLVVQGLTIKPLISWLGVRDVHQGMAEYEQAISEIHRSKRALKQLKSMKEEALISVLVYDKLKAEYHGVMERNYKVLENLYEQHPHLREEQLSRARESALYAEYEAVSDLRKRHVLNDQTIEDELERVLDLLEKEQQA